MSPESVSVGEEGEGHFMYMDRRTERARKPTVQRWAGGGGGGDYGNSAPCPCESHVPVHTVPDL